ncbi:MAG: ammonium transporter [Gloeomargaritaceae cyanobacterium C42_A2020_066]|nr:ammonium transporter [Gloeomargaritaceae cyanobacterium C42_A2020_066]
MAVLVVWGVGTLSPTPAQTPQPTPAPAAEAQSEPPAPAEAEAPEVPLTLESLQAQVEQDRVTAKVTADTIWVLYTGALVFFMNAGFCMLETGFCRQKNAVNLLAKNLIVFALSTMSFWIVGFGIMFGDGTPFFGQSGWFVHEAQDNSPAVGDAYEGVFSSLSWAGVPLMVKFFFQLVFAGTAATIVSGAVAERIKFGAFFVFSLLLVAVAYPVAGHWIWGGGWLAQIGFLDFAGSTVVHSVGGWAALVGAMVLGPRLGRYQYGKSIAMPGHNLAISTLGCFILWLGWFGFNPGSTMAADPTQIAHVTLTTNIAAAMGGIGATLTSWLYFGKPDLSMIINGILAGLVAITCPCDYVSFTSAVIIGFIGGIIVVFSVSFIDNMRIDDPVGAVSVHLVNGVWGTLSLGLFSVGKGGYAWLESVELGKGFLLSGDATQLTAQFIGVLAVGVYMLVFSAIAWGIIRAIPFVGLRVPPEEELRGLDLGEHGMEAYSGFAKE